MTEELVKYENALLCYNKGFPQKQGKMYDRETKKLKKVTVWMGSVLDYDGKYMSAPSQSILAKWLREKHDLHITIHRSFSMQNSYHYCVIVNGDYDNEIKQECIPNRSYEEALEKGLFTALNLIVMEK